jgi:3-deoxy-D-manno-octulosonate 8-phosphate phosphatase (KDO 8-P phosphatase)
MINKIKLVLSDIDGVWTDGGMYYDQTGNEWKKFNTYDSGGVLLCHKMSVPVGIITGENTEIVKRRAEKLKVDYLFQGVENKLNIALKLINELNISLNEVAYIGDDIIDIELLKAAGLSACPDNTFQPVKDIVHYITKRKGGDGAFREFTEYIFGAYNNNL